MSKSKGVVNFMQFAVSTRLSSPPRKQHSTSFATGNQPKTNIKTHRPVKRGGFPTVTVDGVFYAYRVLAVALPVVEKKDKRDVCVCC